MNIKNLAKRLFSSYQRQRRILISQAFCEYNHVSYLYDIQWRSQKIFKGEVSILKAKYLVGVFVLN